MDYFCYSICFLLSFFISSLEFAHNNYPINKSLLYKKNLYFILYGLGHGIISCGILYFIHEKGLVDCDDLTTYLLTALGVGLGIKGFTHISFYEKKVEGAGNINYGPKELIKIVEKYLLPHVKERHDMAIKEYIQKKEKKVNGADKTNITKALKKFLPLEEKKGKKYLEDSFLTLLPEWETFEIQEFYIEKYGVNRYNKAINYLRTTTRGHK